VTLDHPHAKLARTAWEAASHGDSEALSEVCAEDMVWHASGRGLRSGEYHGLPEVLDYLAALGGAADAFDSRFEDVLVGDELVAVLFHVTGRRRERVLDTDFILLFRVDAGRIAEVWAVPRDQHAVDEFWA
jgi:ketosteroid isomerase-like protein